MISHLIRHLLWLLIPGLISVSVQGQTNGDASEGLIPITDSVLGIVDSTVVKNQHYIRFSKNRIDLNGDSTPLIRFYQKFDSLSKFHDRQLVIYHFGGSHLQADSYSHTMRTHLQSSAECMRGPRGWIFPFSIVGTNNPGNYRVISTGTWSGVRSPVRQDSSKILGLMGISASTTDSISTIKIYNGSDEPLPYQFTRFRVYYNAANTNYEVSLRPTHDVNKITTDYLNGFIEFNLDWPLDTLNLLIRRTNSDSSLPFILYGIQLMNDEPGIIYNAIGVNGASFDSYLRCQLFEEQLDLLPPDLSIISIGTNDANDADFSKEKYASEYDQFIQMIRNANPDGALIFTVPNDNYYKYRYPQKNVAKCREVIYDLAKKYGAGVWDFYTIMGGLGSSQKWYRHHLMKKDRIHFTKEGYNIKGDLLYEAFLKWYAAFRYRSALQTHED